MTIMLWARTIVCGQKVIARKWIIGSINDDDDDGNDADDYDDYDEYDS